MNNEQILCIGFPAWEGDYLKSTVQLVGELAKNNRVLYVEYPFTWKDALTGRLGTSKAPWRRILGREQRLRTLTLPNGAEINVLTLPPMLPVNFIGNDLLYDALMQKNARLAHAAISAAMQTLGMSRPVVVNAFNPFLGVFLARQFEEKALIYYCYDEISAAKWAGRHGARLEKQLLQEADAVVTSSEPLFQAKKPFANRAFLVKNGVDFDLFHTREARLPSQAAQHSGYQSQTPVAGRNTSAIGYLGSLDERVDFELLEGVITKLPHRQFRFVGRVNAGGAERLRRFPNVELLGSQPPAELPGFVQEFGVCMIPFLKNDLTAGIYPLKINEYFAAGKPVVATNFGDMADFQHLVTIADTAQVFATALEACLENDETGHGQHRIEFARQNSWTHRAAEMSRAIQNVVQENRIAAMNDHSHIPNNFNRWGQVAAPFFQGEKRQPSMRPIVLEGMAYG